jgi:hypothetical protein
LDFLQFEIISVDIVFGYSLPLLFSQLLGIVVLCQPLVWRIFSVIVVSYPPYLFSHFYSSGIPFIFMLDPFSQSCSCPTVLGYSIPFSFLPFVFLLSIWKYLLVYPQVQRFFHSYKSHSTEFIKGTFHFC